MSRLLKRNLIGNLYQATALHNSVHHTDVFSEAAARRSEPGRATDLLVVFTLCEGLLAAVVALAAGDVVVGHHAIPYAEAGYACADLRNRAGHLVSEDARCIVRSSMDLLQVGAADAASVYLYQHLAGADLRNRNGLDPYVVHTAIDSGSHRSWNC